MKLIGKLREQVENENSREGKRAAIRKAGMLLTDDELEKVSGGDDNMEGHRIHLSPVSDWHPHIVRKQGEGGTEIDDDEEGDF